MSKQYMRELRRNRRQQGLCADCGDVNRETYICDSCRSKREEAEALRIERCLHEGICLKCKINPCRLNDEGEQELECKACHGSSIVIIRKLKNNQITNKKLYDLMLEHRCTTEQLAEIAECSQRAVQRWIFEGMNPVYERAVKVSDYFEEDVRDVFPSLKLNFSAII